MTDHVYRITEIVGTSPESITQAINNGVARASKTLRNLDWFEVIQVRGYLAEGGVNHFQVTMKVGFRLDE
jgi:flavin-binding protein dodecin